MDYRLVKKLAEKLYVASMQSGEREREDLPTDAEYWDERARERLRPQAVYNLVVSQERIDQGETLVWNDDGFCWLRGKDGAEREWQGKFPTLPGAEMACRAEGFLPTQWCPVSKF